MRNLSVAAVQLRAHERGALEKVWPGIRRRVEHAAAHARLVVLPEGTLPGYVMGDRPFEPAETASQIEDCRAIARAAGTVIVAGAARQTERGVRNSALVIDSDGDIAGAADKHFLWHFDRRWFAPGEALSPVRTGIGTIGALVCADGRIPTIARALVERGAQILVMPTAWVTSGRDPHDLENVQADLLARVRARENGVPFVAANKCGTELGCVAYCGKSQILAHDGSVRAMASIASEETLLAQIELPESRPGSPATAPAAIAERADVPGRIAITALREVEHAPRLLEILDAGELVTAASESALDDSAILDPRALVASRLQGCTLAIWRTQMDPDWQVTFARARALELRMYLIVIDTERLRAYALDPDGNVLCGTFGDYRIATFSYDPGRAHATAVAPGTDVIDGLRRAAFA